MSERTALVSGASRGIGRAIAERLLAEGYHVIGTATSEAGVNDILESLGGGPRLGAFVMRLEDARSVRTLAAAVKDRAPTILVNNAGLTRDNLALRMSDDDIDIVLEANLAGVMRLTRELLRGMMRARWGRIINVSSVVGRMGNAGQTNYAAAKAGLEGYSRSLAREIGSRGITVNVVAPGFVETDMTAALDEGVRDAIFERIALGRFASSEEIAALVAFLASDSAGYITGETIHINGGLYMA